ncbi:TetR/AcrR family transcriptional regulator [Serratia sp. Lou2A]|jgi:TetR/AcrR family transcriptional repressor of mexJK operon|uniref:TetR/AcrR family transcriptional regulator n=1 Tax=Serratia montpellierensis TaxID=2598730 RepID=A0ABS8J816_9GAMM|nr:MULTISPECIES: TetR/AcrR family transcriptional regulator [Serratia]MBI6122867.1 TetR/AcrR family transcriptional regulator [Serratia marcescens]MBL5820863.1 TetR/AcrR family transcriptional regulator [Serratia marcescens]MCC7586415.1 TetR/AcrR family transcriptional regulator [Serratia sp. Lou2A]MCC7660120.1 TetR/AcrR family transcriptional regulator [Serratia sp. Pon4B]BEM52716.1 TetR family transcriptional regulator [Serratia marcescens]
MANPNEEPLRARGRPATPETALRAALVQATLALLLDGGYAAATVDAVAKRAGVAKKTLYRFAANRDELVAQAVSGWTEAFQPAFAQDAGQRAAVAPLLEKGLQAIAQQVLSAEAVGMFRLLQSEFPGREGMLESYQRNGIQRGRATVADWLQRQQQSGWLRERDWAQTSDLLLAMTIAEPLRQMTLGLLPPGSAIDERIAAAVALVMPGLLGEV